MRRFSLGVCHHRHPTRCAEEARQWQRPGEDHQEEAGDIWVPRVPAPRSAHHYNGWPMLVEPT